MPSVPITFVVAFILGGICIRMCFDGARTLEFIVLVGLCAAHMAIISLAEHYDLSYLRLVRPVTAALIPPAAWIAFQRTAQRGPAMIDAIHFAGPVVTLSAGFVMPPALDSVIPALFAGYGCVVLWLSWWWSNRLLHARLAAGTVPARIWQTVGFALALSSLSDILIALAYASEASQLVPSIITVCTVCTVGTFGLIGVLSAAVERPSENRAPDSPTEYPAAVNGTSPTAGSQSAADPAEIAAADRDVMTRLDRFMQTQQPFLDPDLTLARLSRRLQVPAKQLSAAINRTTGENVSRYVAARIECRQNRNGKNDPPARRECDRSDVRFRLSDEVEFQSRVRTTHGRSPLRVAAAMADTLRLGANPIVGHSWPVASLSSTVVHSYASIFWRNHHEPVVQATDNFRLSNY